jgi:shikimate kinase
MVTDPGARPIALVGLMGAGKSTVACALGERLGGGVADLDAMLEAERGCSVAEFFEREGEPAFRRLEGRFLDQALAAGAGVIACGGGIVLDPGCRSTLAARCRVVWLEISPAVAVLRLKGAEGSRPLLAAGTAGRTAPVLQRLETTLAERRPLYEQVAQARVSVEGRTADEIADEVIRLVGTWAG